jgi:hypothetical protein
MFECYYSHFKDLIRSNLKLCLIFFYSKLIFRLIFLYIFEISCLESRFLNLQHLKKLNKFYFLAQTNNKYFLKLTKLGKLRFERANGEMVEIGLVRWIEYSVHHHMQNKVFCSEWGSRCSLEFSLKLDFHLNCEEFGHILMHHFVEMLDQCRLFSK